MILPFLIFVPLVGGIFSWLFQYYNNKLPKFITIFYMILMFFINIILFINDVLPKLNVFSTYVFSNKFCASWISSFGINFSLYADRFTIYMIFLVILLSFIALFFSYQEDYKKSGSFYLNISILVSSIIGAFLSTDLFFFFCFCEIMIFPICFLNIFWGLKKIDYDNKIKSIKSFFIHSQISSIIMFVSILLLVNYYHQISGIWTFNFNVLKKSFINKSFVENIILCGFLLSFIIKIPSIPFHTWMPNMFLYSPKGNIVDLVGFLSKLGIYGLLRFFIPISGNILHKIQFFMIFLGIVNIFYGTFMASVKNNLKHILAYINISHTGIMLLSIFNFNNLSYEGLLLYIISSTISSSSLLVLSGRLYKKTNTYNLKKFSGLWNSISLIPSFFLFFSLSNFGLPGTGNFISEILIFVGLFLSFPKISILLTISLIFFAFCSLKMFHRIFYGDLKKDFKTCDLSFLELFLILFLTLLLILIGLFPNFIFYNFNFLNIFFN
ncbi:NADH-quinone oxidoreductase subunit M [Buchnera aphidicola (Chaitoregma tattakana)]|uniref:complex I subunit 4 family protein n=1 Tax=Buchnera aphidicola TaxID=9 RepID=UPI0031B80529